MGLSHVLDMHPAPIENPSGITLDEASEQVSWVLVEICRLVQSGYGSYMEVAYEFSYEEAMDIIELLEISEEYSVIKQRKDKAKGG